MTVKELATQAQQDRETIAALINALAEQTQALNGILMVMATDLGRIAQNTAPAAPNYRASLDAYAIYNWPGIGAEIVDSDGQGPTIIRWGSYQWKRRSGAGKYGRAIWFSRPDGKGENGDVDYLRLITFKDLDDPEPLSFAPPAASSPTSPGPAQDPAAARHLKYGNGATVPANQETIEIFNAYLSTHKKRPADADALRAWYQHGREEAE